LIINLESDSTQLLRYIKSTLIGLILTILILPLLWIIAEYDTEWILKSSIIWALGSILIFHPFLEYIYPKLLTKTSFFLLTSMLIILSTWFNVTLITLLMSQSYIYYMFLNSSFSDISLFSGGYILLGSFLISIIEASFLKNRFN